MSLFHSSSPSRARLADTAFWALWAITVSLTAYALAVESFGLGLFLPDQHVPKLHMRAEARVAFMLGTIAMVGMFGIAIGIFLRDPTRRRQWALLVAFVFWLFYLAIPRF